METTVMMPTHWRAVIPAQHTDSSIEGDGDDGYDPDAELEDSDTNATRFSVYDNVTTMTPTQRTTSTGSK